MSANRLVSTRAIQAAVQDRETEVLDRLGLDWRAGRPHISCPYPSHTDRNPSWRWDEKRARALCTCIQSSHSIFDVVAAIETCDFAAAKVRVAELLGLTDLIRTQEEPASGTASFLATGARSLLTAPASLRDDTLPVRYLAFRLGIGPAQVPLPATPMVGLKALGYYDPPPAGSKAKPKQVGLHPCAVFATIDAQGNTHAHRIYLAPEGQGKANLGTGPDGRPRELKKSARTIAGDHTAGRSVIWGDPIRAPRIILCEGIETAAAVALAFLAEILAGTIAVAAAISASGLEAFQPWPATRSVIVGADRDEGAKENGKPGSHRGETAARTFALAHHQTVTIDIALPGEPGETMDWLDLQRKTGVEAVRSGILAAASFKPTTKELSDLNNKRRTNALLHDIEAQYPPPNIGVRLKYLPTGFGVIWLHKFIKEGDDYVPVPATTPFTVQFRLRNADQADGYGLRCVVQDMAGQPREVDFDRATLARMGATDIRAALFAAGLRVLNGGEMLAVDALKAADPQEEITVVRVPGWYPTHNHDLMFITPAGEVIGAPPDLRLELAAGVRMPQDVARRGTLDGWKTAVNAAVAVDGCHHWTIGAMAGFAGAIVALTGLDTCGVALSGLSTAGKSTAQKIAASAWSTTDIRKPGLYQSARATDNSVEAMAQRASGTVLSLDETAHVPGKVLAKIIYTIAGGTGKKRLKADGSERTSYAWSTFAILSGECSLEEKIRADDGEWLAGMAARITDIDVTGCNRAVDAATLKTINGIDQHYGHAGPSFVRELIKHGLHQQAPTLRDRILRAARGIAGGDKADPALIRAATPFAILLIAGELARTFELLPAATAVKEAIAWSWDRFRRSSDAAVLDPEAQTIGAIRTWIAERWGVTIKSVNSESGINNRETAAWYDDTAIYVPKKRLREACNGAIKETQAAAILNKRGLLAKRTEADRLYVRFIPHIGRLEAYALSREQFGRSDQLSDPDSFVVHQGGRDA